MTPEQLKAKFPQASPSFLRANADTAFPTSAGAAIAVTDKARASVSRAAREGNGKCNSSTPANLATTDEARLNKTEKRWLDYLRAERHEWIGIQCFTLKIGDDCRYTPDLWTFDASRLTAWEIKGYMRDDALVKLKVAARMFPFIRFVIVRSRAGQWLFEDVKP